MKLNEMTIFLEIINVPGKRCIPSSTKGLHETDMSRKRKQSQKNGKCRNQLVEGTSTVFLLTSMIQKSVFS